MDARYSVRGRGGCGLFVHSPTCGGHRRDWKDELWWRCSGFIPHVKSEMWGDRTWLGLESCAADAEDCNVVILAEVLCGAGNGLGRVSTDGLGSIKAEQFACFAASLNDAVGD